jgi:hypothetical protein
VNFPTSVKINMTIICWGWSVTGFIQSVNLSIDRSIKISTLLIYLI